MSEYDPPTENLPIFNSDLFNISDSALTVGIADKRYLKFPTAQGAETIPTLTVSSTLTANNINVGGNLIQESTGGYTSFHKLRLTGYQLFTASGAITAAMSGHTIYINSNGGTFTLPGPTVGLFYNIITSGGSTATTAYFLQSTNGSFILPQQSAFVTLSSDQTIRIWGNGSNWFISTVKN